MRFPSSKRLSGIIVASGAILLFYFFTDLKVSSEYLVIVLFGIWGYGLYCDLKSTFLIPELFCYESNSLLRLVCKRYGIRKGLLIQIMVEIGIICLLPMMFERVLFFDVVSVSVVAAVIGIIHIDCAKSNNTFTKKYNTLNIF